MRSRLYPLFSSDFKASKLPTFSDVASELFLSEASVFGWGDSDVFAERITEIVNGSISARFGNGAYIHILFGE